MFQEIFDDEITFQPSKNIGLISVLDVCDALRHEGDGDWHVEGNEQNNMLQALMESRKKAEAKQLGNVTMLDLVLRSDTFAKD